MLLYGCTIFLSSFLLFLIQPLIGKSILPWFGGSAAVWTTCLVFFQVALLLGYLYAHVLARRCSPRVQAIVHTGLLAAALLFLPVIPGMFWKITAAANPTWRILALLSSVVGLPYVLLCATSPLMQSWYAGKPGSQPYRFFALSNLASLAALCAYPVWIEPAIATRAQAIYWSAGFALFAVLCTLLTWQHRGAVAISARLSGGVAVRQRIVWIALAAGGSMMLLATTNQITQNVAAAPFLWILPLAIYLLTFILCFESSRWYRREIFMRLLVLALAAVGYSIYDVETSDVLLVALPVFFGGLFFACMYCHGELNRRKPEGADLTSFYLMIAFGGALGAVLVGLAAPAMFAGIYELPIALLFVAAVALWMNWEQGWIQRLLWVLVSTAMLLVLITEVRSYRHNAAVMLRSFYGTLRVVRSAEEGGQALSLFHGTIRHGMEWLDPARRMEPTTYYGPDSGAGLALRYGMAHPGNAGIVGLGVGTLATYGQAGDTFHFYEINPQVIEIAQSQFGFLRGTPARVEITLGDARLSLEAEPSQGFDVLAVDAFSGDAIPFHLLTKEAFSVYLRHLKPDGILAIHVSNQFLDLAPVVGRLASAYDYPAFLVRSSKDDPKLISSATWVLITRNRDFLARAEVVNAAQAIPPAPWLTGWTDDYNNLFQVLRWLPGR
jgi:spermidine synthase